jgi:Abnormal spindle-like microcephaly-assoc'd, ASPM-SPD-2-Hydin
MRRLTVAAVVLSCGWLAAPAGAFVYWSTGRFGTIGRANLDGTDVREAFLRNVANPTELAFGGGQTILWATPGTRRPAGFGPGGGIGRGQLDGKGAGHHFIGPGEIVFSVTPSGPGGCPCHVSYNHSLSTGVAVDIAHVYWTERHFEVKLHPHAGGDIGRADLDGGHAQHDFIPTGHDPTALAVDSTHIYWVNANNGTIGRATSIGGGVNQSFITGAVRPTGLALGVTGAYIYWSSRTGTIGRANSDGTGVDNRFITGAIHPRSVAVDATHIYWVNANGTIGRANLDGTGVDQSFITGANFAVGLAINSGGAAGQASASQSSLTGFAPRAVGTTSAPQTLTITNTGDGPLKVTKAQLTGADPSDFVVSSDSCLGAAVSPGSTCTLGVSFKPTATGTRNATLELTSNDPAGPLDVPLTGGVPWTLTLTSFPQNSSGSPVTVQAVANDLLAGSSDYINIYVNGKFRAKCQTTCLTSLAAGKPTTFKVTADVGPAKTTPFSKRALVSARTKVTVALTPTHPGSGPPT